MRSKTNILFRDTGFILEGFPRTQQEATFMTDTGRSGVVIYSTLSLDINILAEWSTTELKAKDIL